jgi:hypothetical protein
LLEGCILVLWVAANLRSLEIHFSKFGNIKAFRGRFSPRIELLASYLNDKAEDVDAIYCVDWGIAMQLRAICRPEVRRKVKDDWPIFKDWSRKRPDAEAIVAQVFSPREKALYLSFIEEDSVFPETRRNFGEMNRMAGNTVQSVVLVPAELGETYEAFENYSSVTNGPNRGK